VRVALERRSDDIELSVEDDGTGFDPDAVPAGHLGLAGMRSRAEALGGRLVLTTGHGCGTRIEAVVPAGT
jgi:signal transduction histidine kinase